MLCDCRGCYDGNFEKNKQIIITLVSLIINSRHSFFQHTGINLRALCKANSFLNVAAAFVIRGNFFCALATKLRCNLSLPAL